MLHIHTQHVTALFHHGLGSSTPLSSRCHGDYTLNVGVTCTKNRAISMYVS